MRFDELAESRRSDVDVTLGAIRVPRGEGVENGG